MDDIHEEDIHEEETLGGDVHEDGLPEEPPVENENHEEPSEGELHEEPSEETPEEPPFEWTIEDLYKKLEAEIAARELLEKRLNSQSSGLANIESRLGSQLQTSMTELDSRMETVEDQTTIEATVRAGADETLRSSIDACAEAIQGETKARTLSDQEIQEQVKSSVTEMAVIDSRLESCEADIKENASAIADERRERTEEQTSMNSEIQTTKFELLQKVSEHNAAVEMLISRVGELDEQITAEFSARENTDANVQVNSESIDEAAQKILALETDVVQLADKLIDKDLIPEMVDAAVADEFKTQKEEVQAMLDSQQETRQIDFNNIQKSMAQMQTIYEQNEGVLAKCKESVASLRTLFNLLLPKGTILPYAGKLSEVPDGWRLCNGTDGTPDLVGKVLVGAHAVSEIETEYLLGAEGGEKEVRLDSSNTPQHFHYTGSIEKTNEGTVFISGNNEAGKQNVVENIPAHDELWGIHEWSGRRMQSYVHPIGTLEKDTPVNTLTSAQVSYKDCAHNNMQPYYCVYYIMKMF